MTWGPVCLEIALLNKQTNKPGRSGGTRMAKKQRQREGAHGPWGADLSLSWIRRPSAESLPAGFHSQGQGDGSAAGSFCKHPRTVLALSLPQDKLPLMLG